MTTTNEYKFPHAKVGDTVVWNDNLRRREYILGYIEDDPCEYNPCRRKLWDRDDSSYLFEEDIDEIIPCVISTPMPEHVKRYAISSAVHWLEANCRHWASPSLNKLTIEHFDKAKKELAMEAINVLKEYEMIVALPHRESYVINDKAKAYLKSPFEKLVGVRGV